MVRSWILLTALVLVWTHSAQPQIRRCGTELANMVNFICDGRVATPRRPVKRTGVGESGMDDPEGESYWAPVTITDVFLDRSHALRLLKRSYATGDRIADECCRKSCSFKEISAYCLVDPTTPA